MGYGCQHVGWVQSSERDGCKSRLVSVTLGHWAISVNLWLIMPGLSTSVSARYVEHSEVSASENQPTQQESHHHATGKANDVQ